MKTRHFASLAVLVVSGVLLASCSDPVPPAKQGAVTFNFTSHGGQDCPVAGFTGTFGSVSGSSKSELTDGSDGSVDCQVTDAGGGVFGFNGSIVVGTNSFSISGNAQPGQTTHGASVTVVTSQTTATFVSGMSGCDVTLMAADGSGLSASAGRIWAGFTCSEVENPNMPGSQCSIEGRAEGTTIPPGGYIVFENCKQ